MTSPYDDLGMAVSERIKSFKTQIKKAGADLAKAVQERDELKKKIQDMESHSKDLTPKRSYKALHKQILVVATTRIEGTWCAYIGPVRGVSHENEYRGVLLNGNKLPEDLATFMFPDFANGCGLYAT